MKDQVKEMFDQITMPEETVQKIQKAMAEKPEGKTNRGVRPARRLTTVAAALAAVLLFGCLAANNTVRAAVNEMVRYVFGVDFQSVDEDGVVTDITWASPETGEPVFVEAGDGKMYFSIDGQYIDITDKTSKETPYIYTYVDAENIEHLLIIGGEPDNFGVSEFYREIVEDQESWQGWIGGYSKNFIDNETEKAYPWLAAAWEELDLPWPMPGT